MGLRSSAARRANRKPENTMSDEPTTSKASERSTASMAAFTRGCGTFSPKKTTSGFMTPLHLKQPGTEKAFCAVSASCASPSGFSASMSAFHFRFADARRRCHASRASNSSQLMQRTRLRTPCRSMTLRLPARRCRPSTFCVIRQPTLPDASRVASAVCAGFGLAVDIRSQPAKLRAQ